MLIDTHCHLHDPEWFTPEQQADFLQNAHQNGVEKIICIGTNPEDSLVARDFATQHKNVFWTYGIHPEFANNYVNKAGLESGFLFEGVRSLRASMQRAKPVTTGLSDASLEQNRCCLNQPCPVAIGEIGLDYHYEGYNRNAQIQLFEKMLQLARDFHLPVSLHLREAFADAFAVLDNFPEVTGVVHSFTGSKKDLKNALNRGFAIGINGLVTYTTPALPPLGNMVLETDAPFLTPVPFRGTINKPGYVKVIATYLAEKLGVAESEVMEQTTKNARKIFQI